MKKCRICKGTDYKKIFSLGKQPLANNLPDKPTQVQEYPLDLLQCLTCELMQLSYVVPKEKLYDNYLYIPSVSKTHMEHFDNLAKALISECKLKPGSLVVDIGSSDGSLLQSFKRGQMSVVGVEPAKNITSSVPTIREYFSVKVARDIVKEYGRAKLITATNSFAHIDNLREYLKALDMLLDEDGVFFAQFPDVKNLFKENQFDTIYHEHLSYFTEEPLYYLFKDSPFELFKIDRSTIHGGSMRIYVRRRKDVVKNFVANVSQIKKDLWKYIVPQVESGRKVIGFGAAAKGVVLLSYCELNNDYISYVVDGTPYKQGKYIPKMNIPIVKEEVLLKEKPGTIVLILAWNFKDEIMEKLKGRGYVFIVPIPEVKIYE